CQSGEGDAQIGLSLASALGWFWQMHGYLTEAHDRLQSLLEADARCGWNTPLDAKAASSGGPYPSGRADGARVRARALETAARFARLLGHADALERLTAEALAL